MITAKQARLLSQTLSVLFFDNMIEESARKGETSISYPSKHIYQGFLENQRDQNTNNHLTALYQSLIDRGFKIVLDMPFDAEADLTPDYTDTEDDNDENYHVIISWDNVVEYHRFSL